MIFYLRRSIRWYSTCSWSETQTGRGVCIAVTYHVTCFNQWERANGMFLNLKVCACVVHVMRNTINIWSTWYLYSVLVLPSLPHPPDTVILILTWLFLVYFFFFSLSSLHGNSLWICATEMRSTALRRQMRERLQELQGPVDEQRRRETWLQTSTAQLLMYLVQTITQHWEINTK